MKTTSNQQTNHSRDLLQRLYVIELCVVAYAVLHGNDSWQIWREIVSVGSNMWHYTVWCSFCLVHMYNRVCWFIKLITETLFKKYVKTEVEMNRWKILIITYNALFPRKVEILRLGMERSHVNLRGSTKARGPNQTLLPSDANMVESLMCCFVVDLVKHRQGAGIPV